MSLLKLKHFLMENPISEKEKREVFYHAFFYLFKNECR